MKAVGGPGSIGGIGTMAPLPLIDIKESPKSFVTVTLA